MADIKETLELFDLGDSLAKALKESKADGQIDWKDLPKWAPVLLAAKKAAEGGPAIAVECKDLDAEEVQKLLSRALDTVTALVAAVIA